MNTLSRLLLIGSAISTLTLPACAEDWPQWRGPFFNGSTTEANLPAQWSKTENVAWVAPLPGTGSGTPIICKDRVFVTSADAQKNLLLICLDRKTGKVCWQKTVVSGGNVIKGKNNMASPSVATDGDVVVAMFGTGDIAAFDFAGNQLWTQSLTKQAGKFTIMWIYGSSPLLYRGKLYVQVLQREGLPPASYVNSQDDKPARESYVLCLDPKTGKDIWRCPRKTDALDESQEAYTTPLPYEGKNGPEIVIFGADYVTAHNPDTGKEMWRCGSLNPEKIKVWRTVTSPVSSPGLIYASLPRRKSPMMAVKADSIGDVTSQVAWQFPEAPDVCTPLYYKGSLFVLDGNRQMLTCLDPQTGNTKWKGNLGFKQTFSASPTGADGKIYCVAEDSTVVVLGAGDKFEILATIKMEEPPVLSSIAAAEGHLFIRTGQNLYCIGKK